MQDIPVKIIVIEDEEDEIENFKIIANRRKDVEIIATTNSSDEGLKLVKKLNPDIVILDLELTNGRGSGFEFMEGIKKIRTRPQIYITTNVRSNNVYGYLHKEKVDFIFYKQQESYSAETVINMIMTLKDFNNKPKQIEKEEIKDEDEINLIKDKINEELDLIGVSSHLKGRKYLFDSIFYLLSKESEDSKISINQYLLSKYKRASSTINRAMQNAIIHAWRISSIDDLEKYYKAKINHETGIPTPVEFIYYYEEKIRRAL